MSRLRVLLLCLALLLPAATARSAEGERWFAVAQSGTADEAIGIALAHRWWFDVVGVAAAEDGRYVTIAGPIAGQASDADALADLRATGEWPAALAVIDAAALGPFVWRLPDSAAIDFEYRYGDEGRLQGEHFTIAMSVALDPADAVPRPVLSLLEGGEVVFASTMADSGTNAAFARIRIAWLDRAAPMPQILFSAYTMGAHCCTVSRVLTRGADGWRAVEAGWLDGDEGYRLEDIDGDGEHEMIARDDRFLNRFAAYARSWTPVRIFKLAGDRLVDASEQQPYARAHRRELLALEHRAQLDPDLWREAGFVAGWMALKSRLGEREKAWQRVLADAAVDTSRQVSTASGNDLSVPKQRSRPSIFPNALKALLQQLGYW